VFQGPPQGQFISAGGSGRTLCCCYPGGQ
jgi:hypothetical protein